MNFTFIAKIMENENKLINSICKLAGSALNTAVNAKNDLSELIKQQIENFVRGMNFVSKEEFDSLKKTVLDLQEEINKRESTEDSQLYDRAESQESFNYAKHVDIADHIDAESNYCNKKTDEDKELDRLKIHDIKQKHQKLKIQISEEGTIRGEEQS